ncbi:MAG: hypothetical protein KCHDKBKB_02904 [Elusimicrobia bacterium]|nr:hypothetical protein [Elusimicrobiota bacterium]
MMDHCRPHQLFRLLFYAAFFFALIDPITDPDAWLHLASGKFMVENWTLPRVDVFSLTAYGTPWINTYWLFAILFYGAYKWAGFIGVLCFHALLVLTVLWIQEKRLKDSGIPLFIRACALLILFLGSDSLTGGWGKQASLISVLFTTFLLAFINKWQEEGWGKSIWMSPFLFMLWANLHRGFLIGLMVLGLNFIFAQNLERKKRFVLLTVLLLCLGATLATPFGIKTYFMMWDDMVLSSQHIKSWDRPTWASYQVFWCTFIIFWLTFLFQTIKTRRIRWNQLFSFLLLSYLGVKHFFGVPLFMAAAVPYLFIQLWNKGRNLVKIYDKISPIGLALFSMAALFSIYSTRIPNVVDSHIFPVRCFDFIENSEIKGPFYNDYLFGGYWMWRFGGTPPVFIDGRYPAVEGYKDLFIEMERARYAQPEHWHKFLKKYSINAAMVKYIFNSPYPSLIEVQFPSKDWALVYWDDVCLFFLRRIPEHRELIDIWEYREILPDAGIHYFTEKMNGMDRKRLERLFSETHRAVTINPESARAKNWLDFITAVVTTAPRPPK